MSSSGNLTNVLDQLDQGVGDGSRVTIGDLLEGVGRRSFGPVLLFVGLVAVSPLGGIPGMPTTVAIIVFLTAGQLLARRDHIWLPRWVLRRGFERRKFCRVLGWMRKPARFIDRHLLKPRLRALTNHAGSYAAAAICMMIALTMPPLEMVPFAATVAGLAITCFALSLIANDGLLLLIALALTVGVGALLVRGLLN
jgi:hypothetical protein